MAEGPNLAPGRWLVPPSNGAPRMTTSAPSQRLGVGQVAAVDAEEGDVGAVHGAVAGHARASFRRRRRSTPAASKVATSCEHPGRRDDQRVGQQAARPLTQAEFQVDQRAQAEMGQRGGVTGLGRTVPGDPVSDGLGLQRGGGQRGRPGDHAVEDHGDPQLGGFQQETGEGGVLQPAQRGQRVAPPVDLQRPGHDVDLVGEHGVVDAGPASRDLARLSARVRTDQGRRRRGVGDAHVPGDQAPGSPRHQFLGHLGADRAGVQGLRLGHRRAKRGDRRYRAGPCGRSGRGRPAGRR